jgi:hypothetical protein
VDVLLRIHAKCIVGQDDLAKRKISEALGLYHPDLGRAGHTG